MPLSLGSSQSSLLLFHQHHYTPSEVPKMLCSRRLSMHCLGSYDSTFEAVAFIIAR